MSKSIAYKHYLRALSRWPKDTLRPECQFQDAIRRRTDRRLGISSPSNASPGSATSTSATPGVATKVNTVPWSEAQELEQVNAIYSLLENRYSKKYPLAGTLMKPSSNPTHYTDLLKELSAAPERGFFARFANKWKGFLRFS